MIDALGGKGQTPQRAWWNDQKELWAAVHTPQELDAELEGSGKELVVVDFYGTWLKATGQLVVLNKDSENLLSKSS
ncbi:hypothetical protein WJX82_000087 [Trebouxia sp. C0006]